MAEKTRHSCRVWVLLLIICFCLQPPSPGTSQERLKALYESAQDLFEQGQDDEARARLLPLLAETYQARAALYRKQGQWEYARDDLKATLALQPDLQGLRLDLAYAEFRTGDNGDAAKYLEELVRKSPEDARARGLLGRVYFSLGHLEAARQELAAALHRVPEDTLTAYTLGLVDLSRNDLAGAEGAFRDVEKQAGSPASLHLLLGKAFLDAGYQPQSQRELHRALGLAPTIQFGRYLLALSLLRERETAGLLEAKKLLGEESRVYPGEFATRYLLGLLLEFERSWRPASKAFEVSTKLSPEEPDARFHLGYTLLKLGRPQDAVDAMQKGLNLVEGGHSSRFQLSRAHYLLSQTFRALGDDKNSEREAEAARAASSSQVRREGERQRSSELRQTLEDLSSPNQTVSWEELSSPKPLTSEERNRLATYTQVLAGGENFLGLIAARRQRFREAAQHFASVRSLNPGFPDVDFNLGLALFKSENFSDALPALERAVAKDPSRSKVNKYLGLVYSDQGQYEQAAKVLADVLPTFPNDVEILFALGTALARTHRDEEAQRVFSILLEKHQDSPEVHIFLGKAHAAQGQPEEAEREFRLALKLDPRVPSAHFDLGMLELAKSRFDYADREFTAELEMHPDNLRARYNLAFVLIKQLKVDAGILLLREIIQAQPGYAEAHYSLGQALLQKGLVQEAMGYLETAVRLDPQKAYSHYQLGRAYLLAGRRDDAQKEFVLTEKLKDQESANRPQEH